MTPEETALSFRRALLSKDREAIGRMAAAYAPVRQAILTRLSALQSRIAEARESGETITPAWLMQEERYRELLSAVSLETERFARLLDADLRIRIRDSASQGQEDALTYLRTFAGGTNAFDALPIGAVENLVGATVNHAPLRAILADLAPAASQQVTDALIEGIALGDSPRTIARTIRRVSGAPLQRSFLIARTETLRAYREASRETYQQNSDICRGWQWVCALSQRTCAACLAMHGRVFPLNEPMGSHPACRCVMICLLHDVPNPIEEGAGETWLRGQKAETQAVILGERGAAAWRNGDVELRDFIREKRSRAWGVTRSARTPPLTKI